MSAPNNSTKIQDLNSLLHIIGKCSHLAVCRPGSYFHHFIVTKKTDNQIGIIHYRSDILFGTIREETLDIRSDECAKWLDFNAGLYLINERCYPTTDAEKNMVLTRARSRLGERMYQASSNNCEHFVRFAFTGISCCDQLTNCGYLNKVIVYFIDAVAEYPKQLLNAVIRLVSFEIIKNPDFYYEIVSNVLRKCPIILQRLFNCIGKSVEYIARKIATVASDGIIGKGYIAIVEFGIFLRDIVKLSVQKIKGHISYTDLVKQIFKRLGSAITSVMFDWRFISGCISSIATLPETVFFCSFRRYSTVVHSRDRFYTDRDRNRYSCVYMEHNTNIR